MFTLTDSVLALGTLVTIGVFCGGVYFTSLQGEIQERRQNQPLPIRGCCIQCTLQLYGPTLKAKLQAMSTWLARFFGLERTVANLKDCIALLELAAYWWKAASQHANVEQQENAEAEQQEQAEEQEQEQQEQPEIPEQQANPQQPPLFPERRRQRDENLVPMRNIGRFVEEQEAPTQLVIQSSTRFLYRHHTNGDILHYLQKSGVAYPDMNGCRSASFVKRLVDYTNQMLYHSNLHAGSRWEDVRKRSKMTSIERFWESIHEVNPPTGDQKECPLCYEGFSTPMADRSCGNERAVYDKTHVAVSMKCKKGHIYGASCLWEWFRECSSDSQNTSCLLCRTPLDKLYDQESLHGKWNHNVARIRYLANERARLQKADNYWSWLDLFNRINLDQWFEISQEEWELQLKDVLLGLQYFDSMQECRQTIERAYLILRGLRNIGWRSKNPVIIKSMTDRNLDTYLSERYYVKHLKNIPETKDLLGTVESLSKQIIDMVFELKGEVFKPSLTHRFVRQSTIFWSNDRIEWQLMQRIPVCQKKWIHDVKMTKDALEETRKWKVHEQSSTIMDKNNSYEQPLDPEAHLPNGIGIHTRMAETYLQKRLSLLMGFMSPDQHLQDQHLQDGSMTVEQIQAVAKNMLNFAKVNSLDKEGKEWWASPGD
ncbi:hypothetical protein HYALB_00003249 [Hymenoscyphus albidus]|uniref:RING-type domain-containing protein n=1 Tax=Hymenoscyphus albidus TaxID=595503 RepID=A0A9N9QC57_9HELO|nr:hypothetical protein HYALB_00003249 [Hymenoscyphus albidus]